MAFELLPESLWERVEPLLPPEKPAGTPGRPPISNRAALTGILFVLHTGCPWEMVPAELGCGSGVTCWRRFRDWTEGGVWPQLHQILLDALGHRGGIDQRLAVIDSASVRAQKGGPTPARTPSIVGKEAANGTSSLMPRASH